MKKLILGLIGGVWVYTMINLCIQVFNFYPLTLQLPMKHKLAFDSNGTKEPIVRIIGPNGSKCSATVLGLHHLLTAAHCVGSREGGLNGLEYDVLTSDGVSVGHAKAVRIGKSRDYALMEGGEFEGFLPVFADTISINFFKDSRKFLTCGYPQGSSKLSCSPFVPLGTSMFYVQGAAVLAPGMSGGPVIDLATMRIVGVNSAVNPQGALITPLIGMWKEFDLE
jgi:hypothetical protein